jgi:hypothetical protein
MHRHRNGPGQEAESEPRAGSIQRPNSTNKETMMKQFQPSTPRAALAFGALALTTLVLGLSIVVPANLASDSDGPRAAAASRTVLPASAEDIIAPDHAAVFSVREPDLIHANSSSAPAASQAVDRTALGPAAVAHAHCPFRANAKAVDSHSI